MGLDLLDVLGKVQDGKEKEKQENNQLTSFLAGATKDITTETKEPESVEEYYNRLGIEVKKPQFDTKRAEGIKNAATFNAIGQALSNVVDAIYGSKGARITKHEDKTAPLLARYQKMLDDYKQEEYRHNMNELSTKLQAIRMKKADDRYDEGVERQGERDTENKRRYDDKVTLEADRYKDEYDIKKAESDSKIQRDRDYGKYVKRSIATGKGKTPKGYLVKREDGTPVYLDDYEYRDIVQKVFKETGESYEEIYELGGAKGAEFKLNEIVDNNWQKYLPREVSKVDKETEQIIQETLKGKGTDKEKLEKIWERVKKYGIGGRTISFDEFQKEVMEQIMSKETQNNNESNRMKSTMQSIINSTSISLEDRKNALKQFLIENGYNEKAINEADAQKIVDKLIK